MKIYYSLLLLSLLSLLSCSSGKETLAEKETEKALIRYVPTPVKTNNLYSFGLMDFESNVKLFIDNGKMWHMEDTPDDVWLLCANEGDECIYSVYSYEDGDSTLIAGQKFSIIEPEFTLRMKGADDNNSIARSEVESHSGVILELKKTDLDANIRILKFDLKANVKGKEIKFSSRSARLTSDMLALIKSGKPSSIEISNVQFKYGCSPERITLDEILKIDLN